MPALPRVESWDQLEKLRHEFDAIGFYLSAHPLDSKSAQLERMNILSIAEVETQIENRPVAAMVNMAGVLLKKQIKVSQKSGNKFAFLQFSDSSGIFEVVVFSEMLAKAKDILIEGETLLLKAMAEPQEESVRFMVHDIQPLDQALSSKISQVRVVVETAEAVQRLKEFLTAEGYGPAKIVVEIPFNENEIAVMKLPGSYSFSPQARSGLMKSGGIKDIREL